MYTIKFEGAPRYRVIVCSDFLYSDKHNLDINTFMRNLKKDIKMAKVIDFSEKEDMFIYTEKKIDGTSEQYKILKDGMPEPLIEKLRDFIVLCKAKDKDKHPFLDYIKRFFKNEWQEEKEYRKDYLDNAGFIRIFLTAIYWFFVALLAWFTLGNFSIPFLIEFLKFFISTFVIRRTYRPIIKTLKEAVRVAINQEYYKSKKRISTGKKHKIIKTRKSTAKKKVNVLKNSIVEEIQIIEEIISKLNTGKQKEFQTELYNLLANYKNSLKKVREQEKGLTLVYEKDIDNSFLVELIALETKINALLEDNQDQYDAIMEELTNNLRESLGLESDEAIPMERTRNITKSI